MFSALRSLSSDEASLLGSFSALSISVILSFTFVLSEPAFYW